MPMTIMIILLWCMFRSFSSANLASNDPVGSTTPANSSITSKNTGFKLQTDEWIDRV